MSAHLPKTVMIVDDEPEIRTAINHYLCNEGFHVEAAASGAEMAEIFENSAIDLILLDLGLDNESGLDLLKKVVSETEIAVVILTGNSDPIERVVALELGADDYIVKPFLKRELLARINAVLRRAAPRLPVAANPLHNGSGHNGSGLNGSSSERIRVNDWWLDTKIRQVQTTEGSHVNLTGTEFDILVALAKKVGEAISRNEISLLALNREWEPTDRSVDIHIHNLRRKLASSSNDETIVAVRNVGYLLAANVS